MMQMKGCAKYRLSVISAEFLQFSIKIKKTATYLLNPTEGGSKAPTVALMKDPVTIRLLKIFLPDFFFFFKEVNTPVSIILGLQRLSVHYTHAFINLKNRISVHVNIPGVFHLYYCIISSFNCR